MLLVIASKAKPQRSNPLRAFGAFLVRICCPKRTAGVVDCFAVFLQKTARNDGVSVNFPHSNPFGKVVSKLQNLKIPIKMPHQKLVIFHAKIAIFKP